MIAVVHPGMMTTVQDEGRWDYLAFGMPRAGVMDRLCVQDGKYPLRESAECGGFGDDPAGRAISLRNKPVALQSAAPPWKLNSMDRSDTGCGRLSMCNPETIWNLDSPRTAAGPIWRLQAASMFR